MSSWKRRPKLNVIQFPLRGRWLQAALRKAISEAGGRPILTSELAEAVGVSFEAADAALQELERSGLIFQQKASANGGAA
jgi:predicted transcriptional regulator